jgi:hypothetical protein
MNQPNYEQDPSLYEKCFKKAIYLKEKGYIHQTNEIELFELTDLLFTIEEERQLKSELSDKLIDYNDEIMSIEDVGTLQTIDISVTGDNLFYCNDILTKNSIGLPQTCDLMLGLISTPELEELGQIMIKQLKNRYADVNYYNKFVVGIDRNKMRVFDTENSSQVGIADPQKAPPMSYTSNKKEKRDTSDFVF